MGSLTWQRATIVTAGVGIAGEAIAGGVFWRIFLMISNAVGTPGTGVLDRTVSERKKSSGV